MTNFFLNVGKLLSVVTVIVAVALVSFIVAFLPIGAINKFIIEVPVSLGGLVGAVIFIVSILLLRKKAEKVIFASFDFLEEKRVGSE